MPEIPDLVYVRRYLHDTLLGRSVTGVEVKQTVVVRVIGEGSVGDLLRGRKIESVETRGPFIRFRLSGSFSILMNLMLAGQLQHQLSGQKSVGYRCLSILLDDDSRINLCDSKRMAKVYIVPDSGTQGVPRLEDQGIDVLSERFTLDRFQALARTNRRKQVRVFLTDQRSLSAIGNAYADEILYEARIHPKTFVGKLRDADIEALFNAVRSVLQWGVEQVEKAKQPIHIKVRDHMRVRNRKGKSCERCGTTIRREGVRGYDVFFCPACQPATRELFLDWRKIP